MNQHINDGTLAPKLAGWLGRYAGTEQWITDIANRAGSGIAPMPSELRRLSETKVVGSAGGAWWTAP